MDADTKQDALRLEEGGSFHFNHEDEEAGRFGFATSDRFGGSSGVSVSPSEARALAALLLKHADRAEGRRT